MMVFDECLVKVLKPDGVEAVGCGQHHTIVATQVTVVVIIITIVFVIINGEQCYCHRHHHRYQSGALWAMGSNSDGQLGVGRNPEWTSVPIQIHGTLIIMMIIVDYENDEYDALSLIHI